MKIIKKIFLLISLIFVLGFPSVNYKNTKNAYNNFRHPAVQELFVSENVNQGVESLNLNNSVASLYFSNLRQNIPFNIFNSCGYVALSMYLSFLDTTYNDNIIPEHLESKSSIIDIFSQNLGSIYHWYSLDHESPGVLCEDMSILNSMNLSTYLNITASLKQTYFHALLVDIFKSNSMFSYSNNSLGLSYNTLKVLISTYFNQYLGFSSGMYTLNEGNGDVHLFTMTKIYQGIPVIVFIENDEINHVAIAYDYDLNSGDVFVHTGWKNENGETINKLRVKHEGRLDSNADFYITHAISIELNQNNHNHIYNYIDENSTGFCVCEYLVPSFISATNLYVDTTPRISWNSFFVHPTYTNLNCRFDIEISSASQTHINVSDYIDNEYYLDYDIWLSVISEFENELLNIIIDFKSNNPSLERSINLLYDLAYDSDEALLIFPGDYQNGSNFPSFDLFDNFYLKTDIHSEGIYITSPSIILDPLLSSNTSIIHYYFDRDISRFDLNIGFTGSEINSNLYNNSSLTVQIFKNDTWITYFDLFQTNLFTIKTNGNTTFFPLYFYEPVNQIRIVYQIYDGLVYNNSYNFVIKTCSAYSKEVHLNPDGNELKYEPNLWNLDPSHPTNCYSYALNEPSLGSAQIFDKAYPGVTLTSLKYSNYSRAAINNMLMEDIRAHGKGVVQLDNIYSTCLNGGYRILFSFTESYDDFHFYRQNKDGTWSHKMGARSVTNRDDFGNIIYNPEECVTKSANDENYDKCGIFEIFKIY